MGIECVFAFFKDFALQKAVPPSDSVQRHIRMEICKASKKKSNKTETKNNGEKTSSKQGR
jgi:hypothetical protein